jgi:DNA-binding beta-propeller fold protein YncE
MRIFVSYSRSDGGDFADHISEHYQKEANDVFIDHEDILGGEEWSEKIKKSISDSDIVIVIVTRSALKSLEVEKEVLESIKQGKRIIPAKYKTVSWSDLKWGLEKKQGIQFENKNSLIRHLDEIIFSDRKSENRYLDNNFDKSSSKEISIKDIKNKQKPYFILIGAIAIGIIALSLIFSNPNILNNSLNNGKELNDGNPIESRTIQPNQSLVPAKTNEENKERYILLNTLGSVGKNQGEFDNPSGIATDNNNNIFIADSNNNRIEEFDEFGNFKTQWPIYNLENYSKILRKSNTTAMDDNLPSIIGPFAVAVDSEDNVYVADSQNNRIQKFTENGRYITDLIPKDITKEFNIREIAVDDNDNILISDIKYDAIMKFTSNGTFITEWGSFGDGDGQFNNPLGIAVDSEDNVYVADSQNNRIQKFTGNGTYITELFFQGKAQGQKLFPSFVSLDAENNVYVADAKYDIIQKFDSNGNFITEWKSDNVAGIAADFKSTVYATDYVDDHIHIFIPKAGVSTLDYNS